MPTGSDPLMVNSCAISGVTGYVGSHIASLFQERGWKVYGLSRQSLKTPKLEHIPFELGGPDPDFAGRSIGILVHGAYDFSLRRASDIRRVNIEGSIRLMSAAKAAGVERLIFISSMSAFPGTGSLYGKAKLEVERWVLDHGGCVIRPGLVFGEPPGGILASLSKSVTEHRVVPTLSGLAPLVMVHVNDLSELVYQMASGPWPPAPPLVMAAALKPWSLKEMASQLALRNGKKVAFIPVPWQAVWLPIKFLEAIGVRMTFRSDSILSLIHPNPDAGRADLRPAGIRFREFGSQ